MTHSPSSIPAIQAAIRSTSSPKPISWTGEISDLVLDEPGIRARLLELERHCYAVQVDDHLGFTCRGSIVEANSQPGTRYPTAAIAHPMIPGELGDPDFRRTYGVQYAYMAGSMANAIASVDMVAALGKAGYLAAFGAAGLTPGRIDDAILRLQEALPNSPFAVNIIHNHYEPILERKVVELLLQRGVHIVESSAFLGLTDNIVQYRLAGLRVNPAGEVVAENKLIAKLSRREVAVKFMEPAPLKIVQQLLAEGRITEEQARISQTLPLADDVTVEADSGGHTDNRPLISLFPSMVALRDEIQARYQYRTPIRIGAAGGIATPMAVLGAFSMGAAFVLTGSINQACVEAGASSYTKGLLAKASMTDVIMAPSADMFEMGVKVQVLKAGTLFPMRAAKLFDLYNKYESIDAIPIEERQKVEQQIFQRSIDDVWADTQKFFAERDPDQITRANANPKKKMGLVFRWYLGLSSRWSNSGEPGREMDYQVWCGPAMGAFNDWVRGSYLEESSNRRVTDVAFHLLTGAAYLQRAQSMKFQGVELPHTLFHYTPTPMVG